jgi:hypothetical protein
MARPRKGEEKLLGSSVRIRITTELRKALEDRAAAENSTITDVITPVLERELLGGSPKHNRKNRPATENVIGK